MLKPPSAHEQVSKFQVSVYSIQFTAITTGYVRTSVMKSHISATEQSSNLEDAQEYPMHSLFQTTNTSRAKKRNPKDHTTGHLGAQQVEIPWIFLYLEAAAQGRGWFGARQWQGSVPNSPLHANSPTYISTCQAAISCGGNNEWAQFVMSTHRSNCPMPLQCPWNGRVGNQFIFRLEVPTEAARRCSLSISLPHLYGRSPLMCANEIIVGHKLSSYMNSKWVGLNTWDSPDHKEHVMYCQSSDTPPTFSRHTGGGAYFGSAFLLHVVIVTTSPASAAGSLYGSLSRKASLVPTERKTAAARRPLWWNQIPPDNTA